MIVRSLLEHPEDLGVIKHGMHKGRCPASIWQLPDIRDFVKRHQCAKRHPDFITVAGHQCAFGVDYSKPTRLLSDILEIKDLGISGWPILSDEYEYLGPLGDCGHPFHGTPTYGQNSEGSFHSSDKAAYPAGVCRKYTNIEGQE